MSESACGVTPRTLATAAWLTRVSSGSERCLALGSRRRARGRCRSGCLADHLHPGSGGSGARLHRRDEVGPKHLGRSLSFALTQGVASHRETQRARAPATSAWTPSGRPPSRPLAPTCVISAHAEMGDMIRQWRRRVVDLVNPEPLWDMGSSSSGRAFRGELLHSVPKGPPDPSKNETPSLYDSLRWGRGSQTSVRCCSLFGGVAPVAAVAIVALVRGRATSGAARPARGRGRGLVAHLDRRVARAWAPSSAPRWRSVSGSRP